MSQIIKSSFLLVILLTASIPQSSPPYHIDTPVIIVGANPVKLKSDGKDLWVANFNSGTVSRVRASDGKLLGTWTRAANASAVLVAMDRIFITGFPSSLYMINPDDEPGDVQVVTDSIAADPQGIAFDGTKIWTSNKSGSISIITPGGSIPWEVKNIPKCCVDLADIFYDEDGMWVSDFGAGKLHKIDSDGKISRTVAVGKGAANLTYDGQNLWVPNLNADTVSVVKASTGEIVATLTGNGLNHPIGTAFDGENVIVTNSGGFSVSFWKAADFTPLGAIRVSGQPYGAFSDKSKFWVTIPNGGILSTLSK